MRRKPLWTSVSVFALFAALALGGCAQKQVRGEEEISPAIEPVEPAPSPKPTVREKPLEPPPPLTAAVEPAPETPVPGAGLPRETTPGLERIHFDFDQYVLTPEAREVLANNAEYMTLSPGIQIRIEGHCDERGTTEYNLALGERRAKSAFQYLMDLGVDPNRMTVVSYGEEVPLDPRHNDDAWSLNRRAEFVEMQR